MTKPLNYLAAIAGSVCGWYIHSNPAPVPFVAIVIWLVFGTYESARGEYPRVPRLAVLFGWPIIWMFNVTHRP